MSSEVLRQIADSIPGYDWSPYASGAKPKEIEIGLYNLGLTKLSGRAIILIRCIKNLPC